MFQVKDNAIGNIKYVGISRAVVVDNNDPLKRGRIRVNSPVLGKTNWIPYLTSPGTFNVPDIDTVVYIQCDGGYYTHPVAWGNLNYGDDDDLQFPEEFQRVAPTNRGIYTPGGHLIEIDDGEDATGTGKGIRITTTDKTIINITDEELDHSITITFDDGLEIIADGTNDDVSITTDGGLVVDIDGKNDAVNIDTNNGEHLELSKENGFQLSTPDDGGTSASFKGGKIDIVADSDITLTSTNGTLVVTTDGDVEHVSSTGTYSITADGDVTITSNSGNLDFVDGNGNEILLDSSGIDLTDANGNEVAMTSSGVMVTDSAGGELNISGGQVALGGASAELLDLVDQIIDQIDQTETQIQAITVPTAVGPSGPPVNSPAFAAIQATLATIKGLLGGIKGTL